MSDFPALEPSDFVTDLGEEDVEAVSIGDEGEYIVAYGHVDPGYMLEMAGKIIASFDDPEYFDEVNLDDLDVRWVWAETQTPAYSVGDWIINWGGVTKDTDNAFPMTVLTLW